jgi:hypothetical protein
MKIGFRMYSNPGGTKLSIKSRPPQNKEKYTESIENQRILTDVLLSRSLIIF